MVKLKTETGMRPAQVMLVLQAHAPFVRQPGPSAVGEEPLHSLVVETYVPMLIGLYDLLEQGHTVHLGLALSPILLEQLADRVVQKHLAQMFDQLVEQAEAAVAANRHDEYARYIAQFYLQLHGRSQRVFERDWNRDIVAATRTLVEAGVIEPLLMTATNIVPHLHDQLTQRIQLQAGLISVSRHLGRRPEVLWAADDPLPPSLIPMLPPLGIHGVIGKPDTTPSWAAVGWLDKQAGIWVLPPNEQLGLHVRSLTLGYPGDAVYRSAQPELSNNGMRYDPFYAYARARLHARHFVAVLEDLHSRTPAAQQAQLMLATQMEVFGSGWFEGGMWLRSLIEAINRSTLLQLTTPSSALAEASIEHELRPAPVENGLIDGAIHTAALRLRQAIAKHHRFDAGHERVLNQAARELLLAQSGDWDRWQGTAAADYGLARRTTHLAHVHDLLRLANSETLAAAQLAQVSALEEACNPFPFLHYRLFSNIEEATL